MKTKLLFILTTVAALVVSGCATLTPGEKTVLTDAQSAAWTIANAYETVNTATGGQLTTTLLDSALTATHNVTPLNTQLAATAAALADAAIKAKATALAAGASPAGAQAAVTTVLSDPGVINTAAVASPAP